MENSEKLLELALEAMREAGITQNNWAVGGGTVLSHYFHHRYSKDIDVFISDVQLLSYLSPKVNDFTDSALDYDEETTFLSLTFEEGKIDFITARHLTPYDNHKELFFGKYVYLEDPVEIVTKKMFYRGKDILPRDIFDLATVYRSNRRKDLLQAFHLYPEKWKEFEQAFSVRKEKLSNQTYGSLFPENIMDGGKSINGHEVNIVEELYHDILTE